MLRLRTAAVVVIVVFTAVPPTPAGATAPTYVGATTSAGDTVGSGNTCAGFLQERGNLGALAIRRVFTATGAVPTADAVTCHTTHGAILWYSFKTSCTPTAVAAGSCDA